MKRLSTEGGEMQRFAPNSFVDFSALRGKPEAGVWSLLTALVNFGSQLKPAASHPG
jgi:hypothetical protein